MKFTVSALLLCLSAFSASAASAECVRPKPGFEVPDGKTANSEQMAATQKQIVTFADAVAEYARCLQGELGQKSIGKDEAAKAELNKTYAAAHNAAADEVSGLANCFNEQLDTFKASGGGTAMRAVDCSKHVADAANRASAQPSVDELTVEASGHTFELPSGTWRFILARDANPRACSAGNADRCLYRAVLVLNESAEMLECTGEISYDGAADIAGNSKVQAKALVTERSTRIVAASIAKEDVSASVFDAKCVPRSKLPPLDTPSNCKYEVVKPVTIADYYPSASREAGEEGPVTVEFTLEGKAANPKNVRAVASSLYPALDEAAVKAVSNMVMSSNCPNARYRLRLTFQLQ
jgi:TonB family protein